MRFPAVVFFFDRECERICSVTKVIEKVYVLLHKHMVTGGCIPLSERALLRVAQIRTGCTSNSSSILVAL